MTMADSKKYVQLSEENARLQKKVKQQEELIQDQLVCEIHLRKQIKLLQEKNRELSIGLNHKQWEAQRSSREPS